jgi:hypothetical protein
MKAVIIWKWLFSVTQVYVTFSTKYIIVAITLCTSQWFAPGGGGGGSGLPTGFHIFLKFLVNFPNMGRPDEVKLPG